MPVQDYSQETDSAMTLLRKGLQPFVIEQMKAVFKDRCIDRCKDIVGVQFERDGLPKLDNNALLNIMRVHWDSVFKMDGRRGPKQRGNISELMEWRHKLEGHRTQDVPKQDALDFIESVVAMLKCVDAKDQLADANNLLLSVTPKLPEPTPQTPEKSLPQPYAEGAISSLGKEEVAAETGLKAGRTIDFWGAYHFDFADALNEEIWLLSPEVQKQVQILDTLKQPGVVGAQQAMLADDLLAERGPLPWVPDLVGNQWQDESGMIVVGSAYAGFIREYSTRSSSMPLDQYLAASTVEDFQNLFLRYVVRGDPGYYSPIQNLCSDLGSASRMSLVDLCRVSLVERGIGLKTRTDDSKGVAAKAPAVFEQYVESPQASEWLWRRFVDSQARCVLALGFTAEHGVLRLFSHRGMTITQDEEPYFVSPISGGAWANEYADPNRKLSYWLNNETWWTVRGYVNGAERIWYVLPVYHPARHRNFDANYGRTKKVLKMMQASL